MIITVADQVNTAPVVSAGNDVSDDVGTTVNLVGTASEAEGDTLTYLWEQMSGTGVLLSSSSELQTSFSGTSTGQYSFRLTATDSKGDASSATVNITLNAVTPPPASSGGSGSLNIIGLLCFGLVGFFIRGRRSFK